MVRPKEQKKGSGAFLWVVVPIVGLLGACGPITYVHDVVIKARAAVAAARVHDAAKYAPYEYYGAEAYLQQAEIRAGHGDFLTAWRYGVKAQKMAKKALRLTKTKIERQEDVGVTDSGEGKEARQAPRGVELPREGVGGIAEPGK